MRQGRLLGISWNGWRTLLAWTFSGTLGCIVFSVSFNFMVFRDAGPMAFERGIAVAIILPILLAGPLFFYLTLKLRELSKANHQLREAATRDFETGILNRRALISGVNEETLNMVANPGGTHLFVLVDADHFKRINDTYGHAEGDKALRLIAEALRNGVRQYDLVGRIGGEEFALLLPHVGPHDAYYITDRLRRAVTGIEFKPGGQRHDLSVSIGGIVYREAIPFGELFKSADANLYEAKHQGRNICVITRFGEHFPIREPKPEFAEIVAPVPHTPAERRRAAELLALAG